MCFHQYVASITIITATLLPTTLTIFIVTLQQTLLVQINLCYYCMHRTFTSLNDYLYVDELLNCCLNVTATGVVLLVYTTLQ